MKRKLFQRISMPLIFAGLIMFAAACTQKEPSECIIWKTEINGSTFYLAGSIHSAKEAYYPLPETYTDYYQKADKLILELEKDFEGIEQEIFNYAQKDTLPESDCLNNYLKPESIEKLKKIFTEDELDKYFKYEGWLLNMTITGTKSKLVGFDPLLAVDRHFHQLATKDNKEIIGLDDIKTQIVLFEFDAPVIMQVQVLENTISNMESQAEKELPLLESYFSDNLALFEEEFLKSMDLTNPQVKQAYDMVFTSRNKNWVEKFEKLAEEQPATYFVLVGAGHYFGPDNVRELLEKKGYTVEKI
ncbi:MAG: TraB/GumN family protein [Bacteroidales bacterium]|nr:TraB/GumN family protein [Bacteroidales bacterium]